MKVRKFVSLGEAGFTFEYFKRLAESEKSGARFLQGIRFSGKCVRPFAGDRVRDIYLFPNFGRCSGLGQPDAVVFTASERVLLIAVEAEIDPRRWDDLIEQLIRGGAGPADGDRLADLVDQYQATPLYQMERFHMIGAGTILCERGNRDPWKRYCGVLPFSDQFALLPIVRHCLLRRRAVLQGLIRRIRAAREFYVVLFSIRGKPLSGIGHMYSALGKIAAASASYRRKWSGGEIRYRIPPALPRSGLNLIVAGSAKHHVRVDRFGYIFHHRGFDPVHHGHPPESPGSETAQS